jgi:hypothetical protein
MAWRWVQRAGSVASLVRLVLLLWIFFGPPTVILALSQAWEYLGHANLAFQFLVALGVLTVFGSVVGAILYFLLTSGPNEAGPRWWKWRRLPIQKISWDFLSAFGSHRKGDESVKFLKFNPRFRINWGDGIKPHHCYLDFRAKGLRIPVWIEHGNPYLRAERIPFIERHGFIWGSQWLHCSAAFQNIRDDNLDAPYVVNDRDAFTAGEFFERFGSFDFVFEYDNKVFRKRFSRARIAQMFRSQISRHGPWAH